MGDTKIFRIGSGKVEELAASSVALEKSLQNLLEKNLETFLGIRFLATEYSTGKTHAGRIDTMGIDENGCPVIIEYKRAINENVISQGLFYLDWLLDHKAEFKLLAQEKYGKNAIAEIEWEKTRLLCIAGEFTKYDIHAVMQINRNIELIKYRKYGNDLLLLEQVNSKTAVNETKTSSRAARSKGKGNRKEATIEDSLSNAPGELRELFDSMKHDLLSLGDDVQFAALKYYFSFKRIKNFACIEIKPQNKQLILFLKIDEPALKEEKGFIRDVSNIGHHGTGNIEVTLAKYADFEKVKYLVQKSYESN